MKVVWGLLMIALVIVLVAYAGLENAASKHHNELQPGIEKEDPGHAIEVFKTVHFDDNGGDARVYAVLTTEHSGKSYHLGRLYDLKSNGYGWAVINKEDIWDSFRGDKPPPITPWWKIY